MSAVSEENIVYGTPCNHAADAVVFSYREKLTVCTIEDMANLPCGSWIKFHMDFMCFVFYSRTLMSM